MGRKKRPLDRCTTSPVASADRAVYLINEIHYRKEWTKRTKLVSRIHSLRNHPSMRELQLRLRRELVCFYEGSAGEMLWFSAKAAYFCCLPGFLLFTIALRKTTGPSRALDSPGFSETPDHNTRNRNRLPLS